MIVRCRYCDLKDPDTCEAAGIIDERGDCRPRRPNDRELARTHDPDQAKLPERCSGCGVADQGWHHPGCEWDLCRHGQPVPTLPYSAQDGCHYMRPLTPEERFSGCDPRTR